MVVAYLLLLLPAPPVGVQPEELLLALLVSHGLLAALAGAAHQAGHGGALGLRHSADGPAIGLPHWVGRHAALLSAVLTASPRAQH